MVFGIDGNKHEYGNKYEYTWSGLVRTADSERRWGSYSPIGEIINFNTMRQKWGFHLVWSRHNLASLLTPLG
jgi:hypothetical protein